MSEPFLRWAGSKRKLLPILRTYWKDDYARYVEPFAGSACLFFHISPPKALLGDINSELIFTFKQVKGNLCAVLDALRQYRKSKQQYLDLRAEDPENLTETERATRFIYLNRYAFNGIYRTNEEGRFNVPYGGWRAGRMPSKDVFEACSALLQGASLRSGSYEKTLSETRKGDFVYLDPPYSVSRRRVFRQYDPATFGPDDVEVLRTWLTRLSNKSVKFLVSYAESKEGNYLAKGFRYRKVAVRRNVAGFAFSRRLSYELLISN